MSVDHAAKATELLESLDALYEGLPATALAENVEMIQRTTENLMARAQIEATLAVAEQQERIARQLEAWTGLGGGVLVEKRDW